MEQSVETKTRKTISSGKCIMIFFLAIIALGIEFALYMAFGVGAAFAGMETGLPLIAVFFMTLMIYTGVIGVAALVGAIVTSTRNGEAASYKIIIYTLGIGLIIFLLVNVITFFGIGAHKTIAPGSFDGLAQVDTAAVHLEDYKDKIMVSNVKISKTWSGDYGVFGEIKNTGNRTLDEVEITVYALDIEGISIYEKKFHPVLVTDFSFNNEGPLKPNYSRKFGYKMDGVSSEWSKKVRVEVGEIRFQKQ